MSTFEDALALALDRCGRGESAETAAAAYPEHDLLPYLRLALNIQNAPPEELAPSSEWMQRSLQRLLMRKQENSDTTAK